LARHRSRVSDGDAGRRLDAVVAGLPGVGTRTLAERLVRDGAVLVDGEPRPKSHRLEGGEELEVELPEPTSFVPSDLPLDVVFEDEHLLVIDKPAALVVHPAAGHEGETLVHRLVGLGAAGGDPERPGIVHRLDRDTSGLLLVARSETAHAQLTAAIRERRVDRRYLALVRGTPRSRTGRIDAPIGRDRRDRTRRSLDTDTPREAVTWFEVRERLGGRTLLEARLETGRTHQIRVHLEAIGLPVCGDPVYGVRGELGLERQFLHAHGLAFDHPIDGRRVELDSPLPEDLEAALRRARLDAAA
jgi:23S rRNA pseudouridine1911/1915/1917 synthase